MRPLNVRSRSDDGGVGTNKRYPYIGGQRAEERELRAARKQGPLRTLAAEQLRLSSEPVTIVPEATKLWGLAWLQFGDTNVRCVVRVKRWTADAVGVELDIDGERLRCWIWQGACQRLAQRTDAW